MIDKFYVWFGSNRKTIGFVIILLLILNSIFSFIVGDFPSGALSLAVAFLITMDIKDML